MCKYYSEHQFETCDIVIKLGLFLMPIDVRLVMTLIRIAAARVSGAIPAVLT
jgi:hypothetical protein